LKILITEPYSDKEEGFNETHCRPERKIYKKSKTNKVNMTRGQCGTREGTRK
jgi:hypothetical protein